VRHVLCRAAVFSDGPVSDRIYTLSLHDALPISADVGAPSAEAPQSQRPALGPDGARAVASDLRRSGSEPGADHVMKGPMTVLHVLDHSVPLHSGYSYRSRSIVEFQRRLGLRPVVLTSPKHGSEVDAVETIEGVCHHRTARERGRVPFVRELQLMARTAARVAAVARAERAA